MRLVPKHGDDVDISFSLLAVLFRLSVTAVDSALQTITIMSVALAPVLRWPSVEDVRENMPVF